MLEQTNYTGTNPIEKEGIGSTKKESTKKESKKNELKGIRPTAAFIGASWSALGIGLISYCIGLWNADMALNEKGYYFTIILFGLYSEIALQKSVRDTSEGNPVTDNY